MLDFKSICALARCNRRLKGDAASRFALATQGPYFLTSYNESRDRAANTPWLLQYHPDVHITVSWNVLKKIPKLVSRNVTKLEIAAYLGETDEDEIEEILDSTGRLQELALLNLELSSSTAKCLLNALRLQECMDGIRLRSLRLNNCSKSGNMVIVHLSRYIAFASSLEKLTFFSFDFRGSFHIFANEVTKNRSISSLDLRGSRFDDEFEVSMSKILRGCPSLLSLNISSIRILSRSLQIEQITDAIMDDNCNLQSLYVTKHTRPLNLPYGLELFAPVIAKLRKLELHFSITSNDDLRAIGDAIGASKTITHIGLTSNDMTWDKMELFSLGVAANKSLEVLDLFGCKIGSEGLRHVKEALVGKMEIRELNLYNNNIDDNGCQYLAEILLRCPSLEILHLAGNMIGSEGIKAIASVLSSAKHLQQLRLNGNGVVDDTSSAALFEAAYGHPSLVNIVIAKGVGRFQIGELATPMLKRLKPDLVDEIY
jgi:hypothetical protein